MKSLIARFSSQLREAIKIGEKAKLRKSTNPILNVLISGLGGSGIGGSIVAQLVEGETKIPINVNKKYRLPGYVNENTLVIISSYSGNTEETITTLNEAIERGAKIVCITSGGLVENYAKNHQLDIIHIPGGMPPRACLGYSLTQLFFILRFYDIITSDFKSELHHAIELIDKEEKNILKEAEAIAEKLSHRIPVIYSSAPTEAVAIRFRQQFNENAKMLCWHHALPEMNHNELVGWRQKNDLLAVLILVNESDYPRTKTRMEISKLVFEKYTDTIVEVHSKGHTPIENAIYLIHIGDWISFYLAEKKGVDAMEVDIITHLKSELSKES